MGILNFIPHGKENAISRAELCRLSQLPDRCVRQEIEKLRRKGIAVLSSSSAKGYWISEDIGEIQAFLKEFENRVNTQNKNMAKLKKYCCEMTGVQCTKVKEHIRRLNKSGYTEGQMRIAGV